MSSESAAIRTTTTFLHTSPYWSKKQNIRHRLSVSTTFAELTFESDSRNTSWLVQSFDWIRTDFRNFILTMHVTQIQWRRRRWRRRRSSSRPSLDWGEFGLWKIMWSAGLSSVMVHIRIMWSKRLGHKMITLNVLHWINTTVPIIKLHSTPLWRTAWGWQN